MTIIHNIKPLIPPTNPLNIKVNLSLLGIILNIIKAQTRPPIMPKVNENVPDGKFSNSAMCFSSPPK